MGVVTRRVAAVFALSVAYQCALFAVDRPVAVAVKDIVMVLVSVAGTFVIGTRARRDRGSGRRTWLLGTATSAAFATGNTLYALFDASPTRAPNRSLGDLCMLIAAVLIPATLMSVPTAPRGFDARCRMFLDGLISTAVLFFLGWATVMRAIYESAHAAAHVALGLVVPSIEIVSLAMIVLQLIGRRRSPALTLMALGFGAFAVTSTAYLYLAVKHVPIGRIGLEGGFVGGSLLLITAARQPMSSVEERRWEPATGPRGSVPYVGAGVVVGVAAVLEARDGTLDPALLWVVLLVAGLVLLRQFMSLRVNDRLVHELHEQRVQLSHQASHDQLTGLANRYLLDTRLRAALSRVTEGRYAAVLLIDLDHFKPINDTYGHAAGDLVLAAAAQRLSRCVRDGDTVARLGGDEFAVVLEDVADDTTVAAVADRMLAALAGPVTVPDSVVCVAASIGIAIADDRAGCDPETLLRQADQALYQAKTEGKGRAWRYTVQLSDQVPSAGRSLSAPRTMAACRGEET